MTLTDDQITDLFGPIAFREFDGSQDWAKPKLREWLDSLADLDDTEFLAEAGSAIHGSALAQSFKGNWEHEHCKATAAYREAKRRHLAAGHADDCYGDTIYSRAHANVMRSQGHTPIEPTPCSCGRG